MGSTQKPHVVLVPFPAHGHVAPQMQLARLLHSRGVHVTLVHTELHHRRLARAKGSSAGAAAAAPGFGVEVIPDGLSLEDPPRTLQAHHEAMESNCLEPFESLLRALRDRPGVPPVSCVVADTAMPFAAVAAREVGVPDVQFFTASACGLMGYLQFEELIKKGLVPLKGNDYKTDGSLDTPLDWVPGMKGMRLRDMPTFCRTTDADDWLVHFLVHQMRTAASAKAVVLNTFYEIEKDVLDALTDLLPPIYTVGPLASILASTPTSGGNFPVSTSDASLLQEDKDCMVWLDGKGERSVVYVSFGSHASMGGVQVREFASGLARCGSPYLWVLRPDMAADVEVGEDGLIVPWCAQEAVLSHPAVGLFVTHCGWNSIIECVIPGVPVLGCPVIAEQTTNCRQVRVSWGIGAELPQEAGSGEIAALVKEMMAGKKGKEAREKALEWKRLAESATKQGGSSYESIDRLVDDVLFKVL
ncbi:cyanohydrin beta-glucosyltransferase-like [Phragmites australis]|uniref:cyanohydrin beta-glucosyltransferase-like n=1 Tax=Phragmites australis TaxID=29695 RepID=UPI002D7650EA|nr:cyanohydrin beta-glucosyltransferase-like [Phragmites australis]